MEHKTWNIRNKRGGHAQSARPICVPNAPCSMLHAPCSSGFSIVETIIAIAVVSVAIVAPLSLAQKGLNSSIYARDQVAAFFLAQEAIEYVRNIRDTNNLKNPPVNWLSDLNACMPGPCGIDTTAQSSPQLVTCSDPSAVGCLLTFNPTSGIYGHRRNGNGTPQTNWQNAIFTRTLIITTPAANEANLVATISWQTGRIQKSFSVNERIFNWFPTQ